MLNYDFIDLCPSRGFVLDFINRIPGRVSEDLSPSRVVFSGGHRELHLDILHVIRRHGSSYDFLSS